MSLISKNTVNLLLDLFAFCVVGLFRLLLNVFTYIILPSIVFYLNLLLFTGNETSMTGDTLKVVTFYIDFFITVYIILWSFVRVSKKEEGP